MEGGLQMLRMKVGKMSCTDCEHHVSRALERVGAQHVAADWRKGEAVFQVEGEIDRARLSEAVAAIGYLPGEIDILTAGTARGSVQKDHAFDYDLVIIGSGGAAFSAAIEARTLGARVTMIERGTIGGTCVNVGCVPSKTLLRAAEIHHLAANNPYSGLNTVARDVYMDQLVAQKDHLVQELRQHKYEDLIAEYGFELIRGEARFTGTHTVAVGNRIVSGATFLVATGASPHVPDIPGLADGAYLTSTSALSLEHVPARLLVIGSGYIALEMGQMFHHLGSRVALMQRSDRLLKSYEPEVSVAVERMITEQGMELLLGVTYERIEWAEGEVRVHLNRQGQSHIVTGDALLVATGRTPNVASLNLSAAQVQLGGRGEVMVDEWLRTSNPNIYAAGDVTLGPQFVYVAAHEGAVAAQNAVGGAERKVDLSAVPGVTFTHPAIATVGLTSDEAERRGIAVKSSVLPLEAVPRAIVNRETTGVFKLVADAATNKIIGAHVVAENAGDVIYAATLAVKFGLTIADLRDTLAPYLTMAEGLKLAALTFDKDVSKLSCCAG